MNVLKCLVRRGNRDEVNNVPTELKHSNIQILLLDPKVIKSATRKYLNELQTEDETTDFKHEQQKNVKNARNTDVVCELTEWTGVLRELKRFLDSSPRGFV